MADFGHYLWCKLVAVPLLLPGGRRRCSRRRRGCRCGRVLRVLIGLHLGGGGQLPVGAAAVLSGGGCGCAGEGEVGVVGAVVLLLLELGVADERGVRAGGRVC